MFSGMKKQALAFCVVASVVTLLAASCSGVGGIGGGEGIMHDPDEGSAA